MSKWIGRCKPDSVPSPFSASDDHLSTRLLPGRIPCLSAGCERAALGPVLSCTAWGLSCLLHYCRSGELLPRLFTLTSLAQGGLFSVTLSIVVACARNLQRLRAACCPVVSGLSSRLRSCDPTRGHPRPIRAQSKRLESKSKKRCPALALCATSQQAQQRQERHH